jgi:hypothetical protein
MLCLPQMRCCPLPLHFCSSPRRSCPTGVSVAVESYSRRRLPKLRLGGTCPAQDALNGGSCLRVLQSALGQLEAGRAAAFPSRPSPPPTRGFQVSTFLFRTSDMSRPPMQRVYDAEQEEQLFHATIHELSPFYVYFKGSPSGRRELPNIGPAGSRLLSLRSPGSPSP